MTKSESTEYIVRDYSAVDRQINEIARRESALTNQIRISNFKRFCLASLILAAAISLIIISVGIASRLMNPAHIITSNEPQKIDITVRAEHGQVLVNGANANNPVFSPPPSEMFETPILDTPKTQNSNIKSEGQRQMPILEGITKFLSKPSNLKKFKNVITGWKYKDSNNTEPFQQYCYLELRREFNETIELAWKEGKSIIKERKYSNQAKKLGLSPRDWHSAIQKCVWKK